MDINQQMFDVANMIFENNRTESVHWAKNLIASFTKEGFKVSVDVESMLEEIESLKAQLASQKEQVNNVDVRAEFEERFNPSNYIYLDEKTDCYLALNSHHESMASDKQRHWEGWQARAQLTNANPSTNSDAKDADK